MSSDPTIYLKNYQKPDFEVNSVFLTFHLNKDVTIVENRMSLSKINAKADKLILDGNDLKLKSITMNGSDLSEDDYTLTQDGLEIPFTAKSAEFCIKTEIYPDKNTSLMGLYQSRGNYFTQCESQGFRKITYFFDRPDVMTVYRTKIIANKTTHPVLLSNGNCVKSGDLEDGLHFAEYEDPFKKPSYLFALVAGALAHIEDQFTTLNGKNVDLRLYVEEHDLDKTQHAMKALKNSMKWDEDNYGREYDLNLFNIVAVSDFNMGAMENKSLNVFNTACVLASPETAVDQDFIRIEEVVGHEYFHNWSGNRVTCRDWFQLSLKEGFTVYRDQTFTADMYSALAQRIQDVKIIRSAQFSEDESPLAHPVRPASYQEINNFYTVTVYNKGAEVIRMIHTILGAEAFRKGSDLYFERHDGQAVTTDDFVKAMEDASGIDLLQFKLWYEQAGTPLLSVTDEYDKDLHTYKIHFSQSCPATPDQENKLAFHIPVRFALFDDNGNVLLEEQIIHLKQSSETFTFTKIPSKPIPSILRGFSAPVKVDYLFENHQLLTLMQHDNDPFNRWDMTQRYWSTLMELFILEHATDRDMFFPDELIEHYKRILDDKTLDMSVLNECLIVPDENYLAASMETIDIEGLFSGRQFSIQSLAKSLEGRFSNIFDSIKQDEYIIDAKAIAERQLKNICLFYMCHADPDAHLEKAMDQFSHATNMTDELAALSIINNIDCEEREMILNDFYLKWQNESLVIDKWFALQASSILPDTLHNVKKLMSHPAFNEENPNRLRALIGSFALRNPIRFHDLSGEGYELLTDVVLRMDKKNPQMASRLITPLTTWKRYDKKRQQLMQKQLELIKESGTLSPDLTEVISKSLN